MPQGVDLLSATPDTGACAPPAGRRLRCSLGTVPAFEAVEVEMVVSAISEGVLMNVAVVSATAPADRDLRNNRDSQAAVIGSPPVADLAVYQDTANEIVGAGERFSYFLSVENEGPATAHAVTLTDELPDSVTYVSAKGLPCSEASGTVTCTAAELDVGGSAEVELIVEASEEVGSVVNEATVAAATEDFDLSNNRSSLETRLGIGADLNLAAHGDEHAELGEPVHFFVSVWNDGPQTADEIVVTDTLPAGVELLSATPDAGSCSPPTGRELTCSIGTLAALDEVEIEIVAATMDTGGSCTFASGIVSCDVGDLGADEIVDITLTVRPESQGRVVNSAEVSALAGPADPVPESNISTLETQIGLPPV